MNKFFRALIAAWGAKKLGGGCLSTIVIFIIIYTLLGKCNQPSQSAVAPVCGSSKVVKAVNPATTGRLLPAAKRL